MTKRIKGIGALAIVLAIALPAPFIQARTAPPTAAKRISRPKPTPPKVRPSKPTTGTTATTATTATTLPPLPGPAPTGTLWSAQGYGANPVIDEPVVLDVDASVAGLTITATGELRFAEGQDHALTSTGNIVVEGRLVMRPSSPDVEHRLTFTGIDESRFVGGGMDVLDSDVGLWVMGAGQLDLQGTSKSAWTRTGDHTGWQPGDHIVAAPSAKGDHSFREATYPALPPTQPVIAGMPAPEVLNLTRNVVLEGTPSGDTHVFIRSTQPQSIRYVEGRFLGPRHNPATKVLGRYGFHFHHSMGAAGSIVEGSVVHSTKNHAFVPHNSDGVTFLRNIAYDVVETPYWWDPGSPNDEPEHSTNGVLWQENVAAKVSGSQTESTSGFLMAQHDPDRPTLGGNRAIGNVAVGVDNPDRPADRGFDWDAKPLPTQWTFVDNVAHNNDGYGVRLWQNLHGGAPLNPPEHLSRTWIYHNSVGIQIGAYTSQDTFDQILAYGNGTDLEVHATSQEGPAIVISNSTGRLVFGHASKFEPLQPTIIRCHSGPIVDESEGLAWYVVEGCA